MKPDVFYRMIYHTLSTTPLKADCGVLCGKACCQENETGSGMYLYPYEINVFSEKPKGAIFSQSDFCYGGACSAILYECDGTCSRSCRPLACRLFPLVPYRKDGKTEIIIDPRAKGLCPLATGIRMEDFQPEFRDAVRKAANMLVKVPEIRDFLEAQSRLMDEYCMWHGKNQ